MDHGDSGIILLGNQATDIAKENNTRPLQENLHQEAHHSSIAIDEQVDISLN